MTGGGDSRQPDAMPSRPSPRSLMACLQPCQRTLPGMTPILMLVLYIGVLILLILGGLVFWMRAVASRTAWTCPSCGERGRSELGSTAHCPSCGHGL